MEIWSNGVMRSPNLKSKIENPKSQRWICFGFGICFLGFLLALFLSAPELQAASNPPALPSRTVVRTNAVAAPQRKAGTTNALASKPQAAARTKAVPAAQPLLTRIKSQTID